MSSAADASSDFQSVSLYAVTGPKSLIIADFGKYD